MMQSSQEVKRKFDLLSMLKGNMGGAEAMLIVIYASSFILSFSALEALASDNGVTGRLLWVIPLSWLWPLALDSMIMVSSLVDYQAVKRGLGDIGAHKWVGIFTFASLVFNCFEAIYLQWHEIVAIIDMLILDMQSVSVGTIMTVFGKLILVILIRSVPPLGMYITFEQLLMRAIRADNERRGLVKNIDALRVELDSYRDGIKRETNVLDSEKQNAKDRLNDLLKELEIKQAKLDGLNLDLKIKRAELGGKKKVQPTEKISQRQIDTTRRHDIVRELYQPDMAWAELSRLVSGRLNKSTTAKTVRLDAIALGLYTEGE